MRILVSVLVLLLCVSLCGAAKTDNTLPTSAEMLVRARGELPERGMWERIKIKTGIQEPSLADKATEAVGDKYKYMTERGYAPYGESHEPGLLHRIAIKTGLAHEDTWEDKAGRYWEQGKEFARESTHGLNDKVRNTLGMDKDESYTDLARRKASEYTEHHEPGMMERIKQKIPFMHHEEPETSMQGLKHKAAEYYEGAKQKTQDAVEYVKEKLPYGTEKYMPHPEPEGYLDRLKHTFSRGDDYDDLKSKGKEYLDQAKTKGKQALQYGKDKYDDYQHEGLLDKVKHTFSRGDDYDDLKSKGREYYDQAKMKGKQALQYGKDKYEEMRPEYHQEGLLDKMKHMFYRGDDHYEARDDDKEDLASYRERVAAAAHQAIDEAMAQIEWEQKGTMEAVGLKVKNVLQSAYHAIVPGQAPPLRRQYGRGL